MLATKQSWSDFAPDRMDSTLKDLMNMVRASNPDARRRGTKFDFSAVYAEGRTPVYRMRELGSTTAGRFSPDDSVTLASKKFQVGDLIDVAISNPRPTIRGMRRRPYWTIEFGVLFTF